MNFDKFIEKYFDPNDDSGFNEILFQRQSQHKAIEKRLKGYYLTEKEISKLMEIIVKAEMEMENIKRKFNAKKYTEKELFKLRKNLLEIQVKMKKDFDESLSKVLKKKYEEAKKIKEELDKKNPYN